MLDLMLFDHRGENNPIKPSSQMETSRSVKLSSTLYY